jgi:soluble lytic murein transglycosylase-like protein
MLIWAICPVSVEAEIYKYVKDGVVHYTDNPPAQIAYDTIGKKPVVTSSGKKTLISPGEAPKTRPYLDIIQKVAKTYEVNPKLVQAIIKVESGYNARAVSPKGAQGLMQLMPATATRFGVSDSFDPEENITGGVKYLCYLFEEFGENNLDLVLAGYNAGEQAVKKYNNQIPPYAETKQYVKQVLAIYSPSSLRKTKAAKIYRYVNKNGVVTFTNVPKVY